MGCKGGGEYPSAACAAQAEAWKIMRFQAVPEKLLYLEHRLDRVDA
jgi:hypothetical protein